MIAPFTLRPGNGPLVVSIPHAGTYVPPEVADQLNDAGRAVTDTDWFVDKLYDFLEPLNVTVLTATHSRYVVDLNRAPGGGLLYPGQAETGICPTETFAGAPIYHGAAPDDAEKTRRVALYWQPYHDELQAALTRIRAAHGFAHLLDAHSILGTVPRLFEGALPDLNFGTNNGASCAAELAGNVVAAAAGHGFSHILNGRFKGGHITRHYGAPARHIHALQLELAQRTYMDEAAAPSWSPAHAARLVAVLERVVAVLGGG